VVLNVGVRSVTDAAKVQERGSQGLIKAVPSRTDFGEQGFQPGNFGLGRRKFHRAAVTVCPIARPTSRSLVSGSDRGGKAPEDGLRTQRLRACTYVAPC